MDRDSTVWVGPRSEPERYQLVERLGVSSDGELWRATVSRELAEDEPLELAIHIAESVDDPTVETAWDIYAQLLIGLRHPNLVPVRAAFTGRDKHLRGEAAGPYAYRYVVMDDVPGPTLSQWSAQHPDAGFADRRAILQGIAAGLDELHSGWGIGGHAAHGAVTPANIIVGPGGVPVLVSLGSMRVIAREADDAFAAPELRARPSAPTVPADAYALGATAVSLFTGAATPLDGGGGVDQARLAELFSRHALTSDRPWLRRRLLTLMSATPQTRPEQLQHVFDDRRRVPGVAGLAAAAIVALLGAGVAIAAVSPADSTRVPSGAPTGSVAPVGAELPGASSGVASRSSAAPTAAPSHPALVVTRATTKPTPTRANKTIPPTPKAVVVQFNQVAAPTRPASVAPAVVPRPPRHSSPPRTSAPPVDSTPPPWPSVIPKTTISGSTTPVP